VLAVHQGLSYEAIAEVLHIPVGTVKSRVFNALSSLQEMYDEPSR
jgi:DNA-directed RNA polymerase specialized sigma24 family protein